MKTSEKFLQYTKKRQLFYLKNESNTIFNLPYKLGEGNNATIHIEIDDDTNTVRSSFIAPLYNNSDHVKNQILLLNPRLVKGSMGISENAPSSLEYTVSFIIEEDEEMTDEKYDENIEFCLSLYMNLIQRKIVKDLGNDGKSKQES